jgi:solute carrier family 25 protein 44
MAFVGGGVGSVIGQTLSVPIDVISQHLMLHGQRGSMPPAQQQKQNASASAAVGGGKIRDLDRIQVPESLKNARSFRIVNFICEEIYRHEKLRGFYRGYVLTTFLVSLNSSLWWPFYYFYQGTYNQ